MKKGLVSIFIPSYNYERYIGAAIDSIFAQTFTDWELIVVDDASTDESPSIIERYRRRYPDRIRSVLLKKNVGQSEASNIGLGMAEGEFACLLAADDVARPQRIEAGMAIMRSRPEVAAAFSRVAFIDADGRPLPGGAQSPFNRDYDDIRWQLLGGNFLCATSALVRLAAMRETGGLNHSLGYVEDYDLWLRMLDRYELLRVDDVWVDYRLHGANLSLAAESQQQRFGPLYESVAVAVRAMHRWPLERLHRFRHRVGSREYRREAATVQMRLARCCLDLENNFLAQVSAAGALRPALGIAAAYGFTLDALQNDPDNDAARLLLNEIYLALGDQPRAAGGKSATLGDLASGRSALQPPIIPAAPAERVENTLTNPYREWVGQQDLTLVEARQYDLLAADGGLVTRFHLAMILPPGQEAGLLATLKSLTAQLHQKVIFTVVATTDGPPGFSGDRLRWLRADDAPLAAVNQSLLQEESDWVGLIACGDQLAQGALLRAAEAIGRHPDWQIVYTDDDRIDADGALHTPRLKPDFDLTLLESSAYVDGLVLTRWQAFASAGGFDPASGTAAGVDLLLRIAERSDGSAVGHLAGPQLHRVGAAIDAPAARATLERHFRRQGQPAPRVEDGPLPGTFSITYPQTSQPLVSLIIPTRDRLPMLSRCVESILEKTAYGRYEIIVVDHGSESADTRAYLAGLTGIGEERFRVLRQEGPFSLAGLMNTGTREARGTLLLFLHDDAAALHAEWLDRLVAHAQRPGVGAVGARLLSTDGRLQQAGIVLGLAEGAELVGGGKAMDDAGEFGRYVLDQEVAATSAACLLVRRDAFESIGGFDAVNFPIFLSEVDFCLRLADAGWRTVWTPQATLLHDGPLRLADSIRSASMTAVERARNRAEEMDRLQQRALPRLARDPHYSALYTLHPPPYRPCEDPLLARDPLPWRPLPRILVQPADRSACGHYRLSAPLLAMARAERVQGYDTQAFYTPVELERIAPDTLILQRPYTDAQFAYLEQASRFSKALRLFDLDDLITRVPQQSSNRGGFPADIEARMKKAARLCDRLVVSTTPLAQAIAAWHADIRVVPNSLPQAPWTQLQAAEREGGRPRIGWAGSLGHEGDLKLIAEVMAALANEVDWIFLGHCPEGLRRYLKEIHAPVSIADYPSALAALALDLAVAPLEINAFNEAKSHLKLLEYGVLGYPVVCSDIVPYQGAFPVTRVRNRAKDWITAIREHLADPDASRRQGQALREHVLANWMLDDHLDDWLRAWSR